MIPKKTISLLMILRFAAIGLALPQSDSSLLKVKRIYVELVGDDPVSKHLGEILIAGLYATKRFIITENREKADAILKGSVREEKTRVIKGSSEGFGVGEVTGAATGRRDITGDRAAAAVGSVVVGEHESDISSDVRQEMTLAVRIVDLNGDVIWASTQESAGGKFKGPSADAVDKVIKDLLQEITRLEKELAAGK